jgi:hypothetical protein
VTTLYIRRSAFAGGSVSKAIMLRIEDAGQAELAQRVTE